MGFGGRGRRRGAIGADPSAKGGKGGVRHPRKRRREEAPNEPHGPHGGVLEVSDASAALGTALQRLLGRVPEPDDRVFHFDPGRNRATMELPSLRPPQQISCEVEMEEDTPFDELSSGEQQALRQAAERKISQLMLQELESEGLLTCNWRKGGVESAREAPVALIPRNQRVRTVPPRVWAAPGTRSGEPVFMRLRKLQDGFVAEPPDEYKETLIFRPEPEPWYATLTLCGAVSGYRRLEAAAHGRTPQAAREAAAHGLLQQLPSNDRIPPPAPPVPPAWPPPNWQPPQQRAPPPQQRAPAANRTIPPRFRFQKQRWNTWRGGALRVQGGESSEKGRGSAPGGSNVGGRTPPPPPKPKRKPRIVS